MFLRHTFLPAAPGGVQLTVVPTNRLARQLRKESIMSSAPGAIVPPYFHTLETVARSTYLSTFRPREILTGPARLFFLQAAVRQVRAVTGFGPSHGTLARMLSAITVLEERGITADRMTRELPSIEHHERQRLKNFVLYYKAFEKELGKARLLDPPALLMHIGDELSEKEFEDAFRAEFPDVGEIKIEEFDDFTEPEIDFVKRLASLPGLTVSINLDVVPGNPELTGHIEAHAERFRSMGFDLIDPHAPASPLALQLFNRTGDQMKVDLASAVTVVEARNRWDEVTAICRLIKRIATSRPERPLNAICVALPRPELYTEIIRERFAAHGIPSNITDRFDLARSPLVIDIVGLLEMRRNGFQRDDVLRVLHSPFFTFEKELDRGILIDISRRLRITAGFDLWLHKIDAELRAGELWLRKSQENSGEPETIAFHQALRKARTDIVMLNDLMRDFEGDVAPGEFASRVVMLLRRLNVRDRLTDVSPDRALQERDARAYERFMELLHETMGVMQDRPDISRHGLGYYLDVLKNAISGEQYVLRERAGRGVLVTSLDETRGIPVEVMILAGMEDNAMPGATEPEIFLNSALQRARTQRLMQRKRYLFYRAAGNWKEHLYITYPLRDAGVDLVRSSFVDAFLSVASVTMVDAASPSITGDAFFSEEDFLGWYTRGEQGEKGADLPRRLREKARRLTQARQIERSRTFTHELGAYEGMIGATLSSRASSALTQLGAAAFSVTDLETYGECPFRFLAGNLLGLRSPAEFIQEVSGIERGFVVHDVLFEFFRQRRARDLPPVRELSDREFEDAVRELEGIAERRLNRMDIPGPFWEMEKDYILGRSDPEPGLLHEFLLAERGRTDQAQPAFFEVAFGQRGSRPDDVDPKLSTPAPVRIGEVNLRGRIDRVDLAADCLVVIDYKTGSAVPTLAEIRSGASLQLPLYLRAAEQLLDREGATKAPAAGLYYRLRDPVELRLALGSGRYNGVAFTVPRTSRRVLKTQEELESIIDAAVQRANAYVQAMKRGEFPLAPPEQRETACRYCEYKTTCRVGTVMEEREGLS